MVRSLDPVDCTVVDAIPVTTPTRTIVDLASVLPEDVLEEALDEALRRRLTSLRRLEWRINALGAQGRKGAGVLRELIEERRGTRTPESVLETRFLVLIKNNRLPMPERQYEIRDARGRIARVDFAYPRARLVLEVDGYRHHSGRAKWERDLERRNAITALGWRVLNVTSTDIARSAPEALAAIAAATNG